MSSPDFDYGLYQMHLAVARRRLNLAVFKEQLHPRDSDGHFKTKGLGEGLTKVTKAVAVDRVKTSDPPSQHAENVSPLKHVEHKKINGLLRERGEAGSPEPRRLKLYSNQPWDDPGSMNLWTDTFGEYKMGDAEHDLASVDKTMALHTTKRDATVLRAVPPKDLDGKGVGDKWIEHGFVSTSQTEEGSKGFIEGFSTFKGGQARAYMKIEVPKGTHAWDYGHKDADRELVLDRGLEFEVTGEERDPDGNRVLVVKIVRATLPSIPEG